MEDKPSREAFGTHDIARICNVTPPTVINWIEEGKMPFFTTGGGHRRVWDKDLVAFMRQHNMSVPAKLAAQTKLTFLIVDDEAQNREFISRAVKSFYPDAVIETAIDGFEAVHKICTLQPTLVILDIQLPKINGIKVCETIRRDPGLRNIRILAITGSDLEESKTRILEAGAEEFLGKPFTLLELNEKIEKLLTP
jgi:excisionase family DNA binding protein